MVSGIPPAPGSGLGDGFVGRWMIGAWLASWLVAFPAVVVVAPVTRRQVTALTRG